METEFLGKDNMGELIPRLIVPFFTPGANRAMNFSRFLNERLMAPAKTNYGDLIKRWPAAPFVVLNATDMSTGRTFEFTQRSFSRLCSDLTTFQLTHAISASANFPFALNPLPLRNQWDNSGCRAYTPSYDPDTDLATAQKARYLSPEVLERARHHHALRYSYEKDRLTSQDDAIQYVHLLDGGLSDNLAAIAVLRELADNLKELQKRGVKKIMIVQVNAKAASKNDFDNQGAIPSLLDVFWSVTLNPINVVTELSAFVSRTYFVNMVRASGQQPDQSDKIHIYPVYVDFNLAADADRIRAQKIGTGWTLPNATPGASDTVTFLKDLGAI